MYALVKNNAIVETGRPRDLHRLDNGASVLWHDKITDAELAECGWLPVVDTARPADTGTTTYESSIALVDGKPTVVWTERNKTTDELANETHAANRGTIDTAITAALAQLQTLIDFPAIATVPAGTTFTSAQLSNYVRALRDAAQQNRAGAQDIARTLKQTIRLVRGDFDGIN